MKAQTIEGFTNWFCRQFGITPKTLRSRSQAQNLCYIRHCYCAMARSQGFKLKPIAKMIDRDYTTVITSEKRHTELLPDKKYRRTIGKKVLT